MSQRDTYARIRRKNKKHFATLFQQGSCPELPYRLDQSWKVPVSSLMRAVTREIPDTTVFKLVSLLPHIPSTQIAHIPVGRRHHLWVFRNGSNVSQRNLVAYESGTDTFHFRQTINQMMFLLKMMTTPPNELPLLIGLPGSKKDLAVLERLLKGASHAEAC